MSDKFHRDLEEIRYSGPEDGPPPSAAYAEAEKAANAVRGVRIELEELEQALSSLDNVLDDSRVGNVVKDWLQRVSVLDKDLNRLFGVLESFSRGGEE